MLRASSYNRKLTIEIAPPPLWFTGYGATFIDDLIRNTAIAVRPCVRDWAASANCSSPASTPTDVSEFSAW